jgi:hypothetical protein
MFMSFSQDPTGRPWLRVSHMRVPTFLGRELCQILAMASLVVVFLKLRPLMKVIICEGRVRLLALM